MTTTASAVRPPVAAVPASRAENLMLAAFAALFALVYVAFWPKIYSTMDEASYFGNAYVLRQGTIYSDVAGVTVATNYEVGGHHVSKYPLGMAALVALVSLAGWKAALGVNLLVHLGTFALLIRTLRYLGLPGAFALLYLLHPTAALYSRTAMSDPVSGLVLALGFDAAIRGRWGGAGVWAGLSLLLRTGNAIALPLFFIAALLEPGEGKPTTAARLRSALWFGLGAAPSVAAAAWYMVVVTRGTMKDNTGTFGLSYFTDMFPFYVLALLVLYPGMLLAPALYRGRGKVIIAGLCYGILATYSFWYYRDRGGSAVESFIVGQRYFLACLPLFIVAYAEAVWRLAGRRFEGKSLTRLAPWAFGAVFLVISSAIQWKHSRFLGTMAFVRDGLYAVTTPEDRIYCNLQVGKLLHPGWGARQVVLVEKASRERADLIHWLRGRNATKEEGRAVLAWWARAGREDDAENARAVRAVGERLETIAPTAPLPPELTVRYVTSPPTAMIPGVEEESPSGTDASGATQSPAARTSWPGRGSVEGI